MTDRKTVHEEWLANDAAFSAELQRIFGRNAGDARYDATHTDWSPKAIELGNRHRELSEQWHALRTVK